MNSRRPTMPFAALAVAATLLPFSGCGPSSERDSIEFEPNLVHAMKYQIKEGIETGQASDDAFWILEQYFGTPDEPRIPPTLEEEDFAGLISLERLQRASGPESAEGRGLFRKHCVSCHGVTGNGRGELSAVSDPYPRDYRAGIFKFKSTKRGSKPLREDLANSIRHGIAGTTMKAIPELTEDDIQALVDYVIYLSLRGELERSLLDEAVFEGLLEDGIRIVNRE
ncbi:MAG: cytochrome c, partial [Planctomycetota bacterium]